ncbi:hypothetical protein B0H19DRAFT_1084876 [Mycena capillaripes]|nr:hypothetical protein B0H19DRAFT_1084876 [Mycena capillaripes]
MHWTVEHASIRGSILTRDTLGKTENESATTPRETNTRPTKAAAPASSTNHACRKVADGGKRGVRLRPEGDVEATVAGIRAGMDRETTLGFGGSPAPEVGTAPLPMSTYVFLGIAHPGYTLTLSVPLPSRNRTAPPATCRCIVPSASCSHRRGRCCIVGVHVAPGHRHELNGEGGDVMDRSMLPRSGATSPSGMKTSLSIQSSPASVPSPLVRGERGYGNARGRCVCVFLRGAPTAKRAAREWEHMKAVPIHICSASGSGNSGTEVIEHYALADLAEWVVFLSRVGVAKDPRRTGGATSAHATLPPSVGGESGGAGTSAKQSSVLSSFPHPFTVTARSSVGSGKNSNASGNAGIGAPSVPRERTPSNSGSRSGSFVEPGQSTQSCSNGPKAKPAKREEEEEETSHITWRRPLLDIGNFTAFGHLPLSPGYSKNDAQ